MNLTRITLLDGSSDNYFDNASCLRLKTPFSASVNNEEIVVESEEDLQSVQLAYEQNPYARSNFELVYPVTIQNSEYVEILVNSHDELNNLAIQCIENGDDEDIECIDFTYPLSIATYNSLSQQIGAEEINSDQEFYTFINQADENNLLGFDFPVELVDLEGMTFSVNNNNELMTAISNSSNACDENDYKYFSDNVFLQNLTLKLTDAPFPFSYVKEANVTIGKIDLKTSDENDSIAFITLSDTEQSFNLLDFTNGLTTDLAEVDIPVGDYAYIKMEVTQASVEMNDGTIYNLMVPSGTIRLVGDQMIQVNENSSIELLADFDVSRSFIPQGNPNSPAGIIGFVFVPVIKLSDLSQTGTLKGAVTQNGNGQVLEGVQISVYAADTLNTTSFTDQNGEYVIPGLKPGQYDVSAEIESFFSVWIEGIELTQNMEAVQDFELTEE
ncbi:DUF4382 domain-containing protein [Ekhidna sp.]|uniref:DUF4382 domain-containing protein n=1 Tax=Ekhidna sp. TaxID=2608089 RepID=UPI0032993AEA